MVGQMGSGKTTLALKIAKDKNALFGSLDGTIRSFNQPVRDLKDYESHMQKALDLLYARALSALKNGQSVVFDVGRWTWLKQLADEADAKIELHYFEIAAEERWRRVEKRNLEKPEGVYHFTMSKAEFDDQSPQGAMPPPTPGLTVIKIT